MKTVRKPIFQILILGFWCSTFVACMPNAADQFQQADAKMDYEKIMHALVGGQDTSGVQSDVERSGNGLGGNIKVSEPEVVRQVINKVWSLATYPDASINIFDEFMSAELMFHRYAEGPHEKDGAVGRVSYDQLMDAMKVAFLSVEDREKTHAEVDVMHRMQTLPKFKVKRTVELRYKGFGKFGIDRSSRPSYLASYLSKSRIEYRENGACPSRDKVHAQASVSEMEIGANICFSLDELSRVPEEALVKQLLGLLIHEIMHLNGYDEEIAQGVQEIFVQYLPDNLSARSTYLVRYLTNKDLTDIEREINDFMNSVQSGDSRKSRSDLYDDIQFQLQMVKKFVMDGSYKILIMMRDKDRTESLKLIQGLKTEIRKVDDDSSVCDSRTNGSESCLLRWTNMRDSLTKLKDRLSPYLKQEDTIEPTKESI